MVHQRSLIVIVFISGFVSLVYQTVWLREMRLFFGASTPSTAAVTGIFMLGLGIGGVLLGRRVDRSRAPLRFYGWVELTITALTALTILSIPLARSLYLAMGGVPALGLAGASIVRVLLAIFIIAPPTIAMGATLPSAARSFMGRGDGARSGLGLLYGANTLGAVTGTVASTFLFLETLGHNTTLWAAVLLNALIAAVALGLARTEDSVVPDEPAVRVRPVLVYVFALLAGFTFFALELVWYRVLAPLLGGSTYTFGLILAVALAGIGAGGLLYAVLQRDTKPTFRLLAITFALQAVAVIVPFALGDSLAITAALLNKLSAWGFGGAVLAWTLTTLVVVFPASLVAGFQFPVLVGVVGYGRESIGRDTGEVYLWNTIGSLAGALSGGLILIPMLGTSVLWRSLALLLAATAVLALVAAARVNGDRRLLAPALCVGVAVMFGVFSTGPTAAWRHSPIGVGRLDTDGMTPQEIQRYLREVRRVIVWEKDGLESTVGLHAADGYAFIVNGKSDGHVRGDAETQVMSGLLAALLHPDPRTSLVIGLGTGSTAGWLASVPSMEHVRVAELEPAIIHVARVSAPVNRNVLELPNVEVLIGDGREILLTSDLTFDIIFSEPSNPYRAGIASLFTTDFYRAARGKLNPNGVLAQWVQAYEIDAYTLQSIFASIKEVFPSVETWQTRQGDLVLIASAEPLKMDAATLRKRLSQQPYREAITRVWLTNELEGVLAHFTGTDQLGELLAEEVEPVADDRNTIEFGFARQTAGTSRGLADELRILSGSRGFDRPAIDGDVNWTRVEELRNTLPSLLHGAHSEDAQKIRVDVTQSWVDGRCSDAIASWSRLRVPARGPAEIMILGSCYASLGDDAALRYAAALETHHPAETLLIRGIHHAARGDHSAAANQLAAGLRMHRTNPWIPKQLVHAALAAVLETAAASSADAAILRTMSDAVAHPFAVASAEHRRREILLFLAELAEASNCGPATIAALELFEPHTPWARQFLERRARCYRKTEHPRREQAIRELEKFLGNEARTLPGPPAAFLQTTSPQEQSSSGGASLPSVQSIQEP